MAQSICSRPRLSTNPLRSRSKTGNYRQKTILKLPGEEQRSPRLRKDSVRTKWYFAHTEPSSIRVQSERANHFSSHASHHCWGRLMAHTVDVPPPKPLRRVPDAYTLVRRRHFPTAYRRGAALAACSDLQRCFGKIPAASRRDNVPRHTRRAARHWD